MEGFTFNELKENIESLYAKVKERDYEGCLNLFMSI